MRSWPFVLGFFVVLLDCAALEPLPRGTCGNGVVDNATEDCDSFPENQCGRPADGAAQCRLLCEPPNSTDDKKTEEEKQARRCPDGWYCGLENFCRAPSGEFAAPSEPFSSGITRMLVGDFDGDRRADILGTNGTVSRGRILYSTESGTPEIVSLPGVLASPVVHDFDGDLRSDIAFGYTFKGPRGGGGAIDEVEVPDGLAIFLGQADRATVAKPFSFLTSPVAAIIVPLAPAVRSDIPGQVEPILGVAAVPALGQGLALYAIAAGEDADGKPRYFRPLDGKLVGEPVAGRLLDVPASACGEVVIATNDAPGGSQVTVYSPCLRTSPTSVVWAQALPAIRIPVGERITRVFLADVDDDKKGDVIIGTTVRDRVLIAYGTGTGFEAPTTAPAPLTEVPLAAGLLNAGSRVDFVTPTGVLLSLGPDGNADGGAPTVSRESLQWLLLRAPSKKWTVAAIADLNRDSVVDVVAGSANEPDLDVLQGTGTSTMTPFTVATKGVVTNLAVTDFDFDGTADVAFVTHSAASTEIAISYGRVLAMPPETPRPAGRLEGINQLFVQPIALVITSTAASTFNVSSLLKSTERQPVAPLLFSGPATKAADGTDRELSTANLVLSFGADKRPSLVAVVAATDYDELGRRQGRSFGLWVARGQDSKDGKPHAEFDGPTLERPLAGLVLDNELGQRISFNVAGELGGKAGWESVIVTPDVGGGAAIQVVAPDGQEQRDGGGNGGPPPGLLRDLGQALVLSDREPFADSRVELLDVDGDGNLDLVTLLRNAQTKAPVLSIFFGLGNATFTPVPMDLALADARGFTQLTTALPAASRGALPGQPRKELVVITKRSLFRVFIDPARKVDVTDASSIVDVKDGTSVLAGDFDGDGVQDLAISDRGSVRIARQKSRTK